MTSPAPRASRTSRVALVLAAGTLAWAALGACGLLDGAGLMTSPIALAPECEQEDSCDCNGPGCHCEDGACYCDGEGCFAESAASPAASCAEDGCYCQERWCWCTLDGECKVTSGDGTHTCQGEGCVCDEDQCMCEAAEAHPCECTGGGGDGSLGGCVLPTLFR